MACLEQQANNINIIAREGNDMKQKNLVKELYQACVDHNVEKQQELLREELRKIIKRKEKGKKLGCKWTVIR